MKKIKFTCPHCEAKLRVPTHLAGVSAPCPKCGSTITAPSDITTAVVDAPVERRGPASPSSAPTRTRHQGGTAVLEAPVTQVVAAPLPSAPAMNPAMAHVVAAPAKAAAPAPVEARVAAPARPLPTPVPDVPEVAAAPTPVSTPEPIRTEARPAPAPVAAPAPVPAPRVIEQPPALVAPLAAPALFVPPAPVAEPTAPVVDERSEPPALIDDRDTVVVEELVYEMPPAPEPVSPLATITQPIRISPPAGDLPIARENVSAPGTLPRLDVSLAGQDLSGAAAVLFGEGAHHQGRTRLVLPQPGTAVSAGSPGDFLVPVAPPAPAASSIPPAPIAVPVPVPLTPPPTPESFALPPMEETFDDFAAEDVEEILPEYEPPPLDPPTDEAMQSAPVETFSPYKSIPLPNEIEPLSLDELEGGDDNEVWDGDPILENDAIFDPEGYLGAPSIDHWQDVAEPLAPPALVALDTPDTFDDPGYGDEVDHAEADDWEDASSARPSSLLAPAFPDHWPEIETSPVQVPHGVSPSFLAPEAEAELPANPLHEGSFGRLFAQQAPPDQLAPGPLGMGTAASASPRNDFLEPAPLVEEGDVLDELFTSSTRGAGGKRTLNKTAIMAISTIVGVAIFSIIGVYFVINSFLGGLDPAEAYREPEGGESAAGTAPGGTLAVKPKGVVVPTSLPEPAIADAPAVIDPVAMLRDGTTPTGGGGAVPSDPPAVSFDEKVQQAVNGPRGVGASVIGSPSLDLIEKPVTDFSGVVPPAVAPPAEAEASPSLLEAAPALPGEAGDPGNPAEPRSLAPGTVKDPNYNPSASFPAPGPNDGPLGKTHDLIDAFLRAPDWETRVNYVYQGDSLRATIEDYHKKWPYNPFGRYTQQLYQMEADTSLGGPYWVFIVSTSDEEEGFPLIIRSEDGNLKVDWEIFAEFSDRHFLRFREGTMPPPATFRLIVERFSDYYGSDKDGFTDLKDYYVYQVNPPYGDLNEFSEYAFVKKDSPLAAQLDKLVRLGDEPLAVVIKLDQKPFAHGVKHYVITELLTEGWFR